MSLVLSSGSWSLTSSDFNRQRPASKSTGGHQSLLRDGSSSTQLGKLRSECLYDRCESLDEHFASLTRTATHAQRNSEALARMYRGIDVKIETCLHDITSERE